MQLHSPAEPVEQSESSVYEALLPLAHARILELGCGRAEATRAIALRHPEARITAMEVDRIQHAINLARRDLPNVEHIEAGAQAIPADDASFDVVLMFKSLHHVPGDLLVCERLFAAPVEFDSFADFERRVIGVTHTQHHLTPAQLDATRAAFARHAGADGARFRQPMRVDLLRKPASAQSPALQPFDTPHA